MPIKIKIAEVVDALESATENFSHYLDKRTGEIVMLSNDDLRAAEDDDGVNFEYPDWQKESILKAREVIAESEQFAELPTQFDIHEYDIMRDFCLDIDDPKVREDMLRWIKGCGAFGRFKNAIHSMGIEKKWFEFKRNELEKIAIEWLEEEGISYSREEESVIESDSTM